MHFSNVNFVLAFCESLEEYTPFLPTWCAFYVSSYVYIFTQNDGAPAHSAAKLQLKEGVHYINEKAEEH